MLQGGDSGGVSELGQLIVGLGFRRMVGTHASACHHLVLHRCQSARAYLPMVAVIHPLLLERGAPLLEFSEPLDVNSGFDLHSRLPVLPDQVG